LNGLEVASLRSIAPNAKILFLAENCDPDKAEEALCTGVSGYVVKSDAALELLTAVDVVLDGKRFVSQILRDSVHPFGFERWHAAD
jgi:DNA-binding NarL/FixJ family response regulator